MKHARILAAIVGLTLFGATAVPAGATTEEVTDGLAVGDTAFVDVAAATLWVEPDTARPMDKPSLTNPVDLNAWNAAMPDAETRRWLTGKLETQAVLGSEVEVTDVQGEWVKVVVQEQSTPRDTRGYPGWLPAAQLVESDEFDALTDSSARAVVTSQTTHLWDNASGKGDAEPGMEVSFNTELPVLRDTKYGVEVALPDGSTEWLYEPDVDVYAKGAKPAAPSGADLVATSKQFLGLRYLWAGVSGWGFDCSGFTYSVFRAHGIDIPRDSGPQAETGADVAVSDLQQGDLLFFAEPGGSGNVHHVGMYIGDGKMLHAPNADESVSIVDWKAWDTEGEFAGAKRMI